jgi:LysR family glycine cleavage system transcriptional activator
MSYRLPSLSLLRTFEAAARHLSFKKAAAEVCVTPAAVSQQIKALERYLGVPLFHRMTRALALTEHGAAMLPKVREGFECLAAAVEMTRQRTAGWLKVTAPPSFASYWLVPRLARFVAAHPEVELRLSSTPDAIDRSGEARMLERLGDDPRDPASEVLILYGSGRYPGFVVDRILVPDYLPVCAPALLEGERALRTPADLARQVLIHDETLYEEGEEEDASCGWAAWLKLAGVAGVDVHRGPRFAHAVLALEAARAGEGVTLASRLLIGPRLADGDLVVPFDIPMPSPRAYFLVMREGLAERPAVRAFRAWLREEAGAAGGQPLPGRLPGPVGFC